MDVPWFSVWWALEILVKGVCLGTLPYWRWVLGLFPVNLSCLLIHKYGMKKPGTSGSSL
jgi:hypothetical protein